jgi:hypothetical protein
VITTVLGVSLTLLAKALEGVKLHGKTHAGKPNREFFSSRFFEQKLLTLAQLSLPFLLAQQ